KVKCSLMPKNNKTGKTDHQKPDPIKILAFRKAQLKEKRAWLKGKEPMQESPSEQQGEVLGLTPSPSNTLGLELMAINSGSSAPDTPVDMAADSPAPSHVDTPALSPCPPQVAPSPSRPHVPTPAQIPEPA